jgi:hypothetical protein
MIEIMTKRLPSKFRKAVKRWWRALAWCVAVVMSIEAVAAAAQSALRTPVPDKDLAVLRQKIAHYARVDVGTVLSDGWTSVQLGTIQFGQYFWHHKWMIVVVVFAIWEGYDRVRSAIERLSSWWFFRHRTA